MLITCVPVFYRGDTGVNLVVLCGEKPTKSLLERMALSLPAQLAAVAPEEKYEVRDVAQNIFFVFLFFWRARVCWPLLC